MMYRMVPKLFTYDRYVIDVNSNPLLWRLVLNKTYY